MPDFTGVLIKPIVLCLLLWGVAFAQPISVTDDTGEAFTFDTPPKIGCYWYGCYEILADLGVPLYEGALTGVEVNAFYAPDGPPQHQLTDASNPEQWAAAGVDLIINRYPDTPDDDALEQAAPMFFLHASSWDNTGGVTGLEAFVDNNRLMGILTGQEEAAEAATGRFAAARATLRALATPETQARTVAIMFEGDGYFVLGSDSPFCQLLLEDGLGTCVGGDTGFPELNAEAFLALDPDWIIYQGEGSQTRSDPVWGQLSAVKNGQVFDAGNRYYCCSTRGFIHALQEYAHYTLDSKIPAPGPAENFDPLTSPLVQGATTAN